MSNFEHSVPYRMLISESQKYGIGGAQLIGYACCIYSYGLLFINFIPHNSCLRNSYIVHLFVLLPQSYSRSLSNLSADIA